jgi:cytochrome c oxidase cbb3-type subunit 3
MYSRFRNGGRAAAKAFAILVAVATALSVSSCQKAQRRLREDAPLAAPPESIAQGQLQAGPNSTPLPVKNPYEGNSYAITEGQRLYNWFNCVGCHARGGGAIGPPLMHKVWIYGGEPGNIYASIVQGRPNGMPSWRGKIPEYQVWQIVTFVQSLKGDRGIASPPGPREEHLQAGEGRYSR